MLSKEKRIKTSMKIYPFYYGLSADLMFWAAINTLFLTVVKKFSASQVNSLVSFSVLISIIGYFMILKLIKKIGELNAVKIGNIMLLLSSIFITFLKTYNGVLLGLTLYEIAFIFKSMDHVILRKNLESLNEKEKFFNYETKGTLIYSIITMAISFVSGFIFNLNNYLPMYICIFFCILNYVISGFLYFPKENDELEKQKNDKIKFNKTIIFILLFYLLIYSVIENSQTNVKLMLQYNMQDFLNTQNVALMLSFIVFISRVIRVLSNIAFNKIYNKVKNNLSIILNVLLIISLCLILLGDFIRNGFVGIAFVSLGFFILLLLRDPTENYGRTILFDNAPRKFHDELSLYYSIFRKIGNFFISLIISIILLDLEIKYVFIFLLVVAILTLYITSNIVKLLKNKWKYFKIKFKDMIYYGKYNTINFFNDDGSIMYLLYY